MILYFNNIEIHQGIKFYTTLKPKDLNDLKLRKLKLLEKLKIIMAKKIMVVKR
jgi:hypothetical protein